MTLPPPWNLDLQLWLVDVTGLLRGQLDEVAKSLCWRAGEITVISVMPATALENPLLDPVHFQVVRPFRDLSGITGASDVNTVKRCLVAICSEMLS